ncbi:hypothetical protein AB0L10_26025 [Streptomyces flaveolus]|uniref:hypothetical protein n=1 Tax=Streptomyces flaveolus TaxID=67297 RepID=UPI00341DF965
MIEWTEPARLAGLGTSTRSRPAESPTNPLTMEEAYAARTERAYVRRRGTRWNAPDKTDQECTRSAVP